MGEHLGHPGSGGHPGPGRVSRLRRLRAVVNTAHVPGGPLSPGLRRSAGKGLRAGVIKDLNCHVDSKPRNRLCRGLNKSALDLWPNLIQQKIISAEY